MKLLIFLLLPLSAFTQDTLHNVFSLRDGKASIEDIMDLPGMSADNIYKIIKASGVSSFTSQTLALQTDDKQGGLIGYKFGFSNTVTSSEFSDPRQDMDYWAIMKVYFKEGRAKIIIEDVNARIGTSDLPVEKYWQEASKLMDQMFENDYGKNPNKKQQKIISDAKYRHLKLIRLSFIEANKQLHDFVKMFEDRMLKAKKEMEF